MNDTPESPSAVRLRDPLSEVTRKERRALLSVSAVGILMVTTGLVPSKVSALGIEFSPADQRSLLLAIAGLVIFFLISFLAYSFSDFVAWRLAFHSAAFDAEARRKEESAKYAFIVLDRDPSPDQSFYKRRGRWVTASRPTSLIRALFEFGVPIGIAIVPIVLLVRARPQYACQLDSPKLSPRLCPPNPRLLLTRP